jgi:hypothetical protein
MGFKSNNERAVAYAAFSTLQKMLKDDEDAGGKLPPGEYKIGGKSIQLAFSAGSKVTRDAGDNGDGTSDKKCPSVFFGYAVWLLFIVKLKKFNQWPQIKTMLCEILKEIGSKKIPVKDAIDKLYPDVAEEMAAIQDQLPVLEKPADTSRIFKDFNTVKIVYNK